MPFDNVSSLTIGTGKLGSPDKAAEPAVSAPDSSRQLAGSRNLDFGSGLLLNPTLWLHQRALQMTGICWEPEKHKASRIT